MWLLLLSGGQLSAQVPAEPSSSLVLGPSDLEGQVGLIARIQVNDPDDGFPVARAEILFEDSEGRQIASVWTGGDGLAVVLCRDDQALRSLVTVRIRAPRREQWVRETAYNIIRSDAEDVILWIPAAEGNWTQTFDFQTGARLPTDQAVVQAIRARRYVPSGTDAIPYQGVDYPDFAPVPPTRSAPYAVWSLQVDMRRLSRQ
jgi:hypothetical protein